MISIINGHTRTALSGQPIPLVQPPPPQNGPLPEVSSRENMQDMGILLQQTAAIHREFAAELEGMANIYLHEDTVVVQQVRLSSPLSLNLRCSLKAHNPLGERSCS